MLPRIAIAVFLINQPDALIIPILFCYKTLHVSGIFSAHHQEFSTVHSALISFMQVSDDRFQAEPGWNCSLITPILFRYKTLHVSGNFSAHHQEFSTAHSALVSFMQVSDDRFQAQSGWNCSAEQKTPDDGQRRCPKHVEFHNRINLG